ncbi:hypothetical protein MRX96_021255 [Rhipicephalus microplus]
MKFAIHTLLLLMLVCAIGGAPSSNRKERRSDEVSYNHDHGTIDHHKLSPAVAAGVSCGGKYSAPCFAIPWRPSIIRFPQPPRRPRPNINSIG